MQLYSSQLLWAMRGTSFVWIKQQSNGSYIYKQSRNPCTRKHQFTLTVDRNTSLENNQSKQTQKTLCIASPACWYWRDRNKSVPDMVLKSSQKWLVTLLEEAASLSYIPGSILMQCKIKVWDSAFGQCHQSHKTTKLSERHTSL